MVIEKYGRQPHENTKKIVFRPHFIQQIFPRKEDFEQLKTPGNPGSYACR